MNETDLNHMLEKTLARAKILGIIINEIKKITKEENKEEFFAVLNSLHADIFVLLVDTINNDLALKGYYQKFKEHFNKIYETRLEELEEC